MQINEHANENNESKPTRVSNKILKPQKDGNQTEIKLKEPIKNNLESKNVESELRILSTFEASRLDAISADELNTLFYEDFRGTGNRKMGYPANKTSVKRNCRNREIEK